MSLRKMLVALPCLLPSGAIHVVVNLIEVLKINDYQIDVVSKIDGSMRQTFEELGIKVTVMDVADEQFLETVVKNYDEVLADTLHMYEMVYHLFHKNILVKWWIHEPPAYFKHMAPNMPQGLWEHMAENVELYSAGYIVKNYIYNTYGLESRVLNFGLTDLSDIVENQYYDIVASDKITFLLPSLAIQPIKGHDLLALAAGSLPEKYTNQIEFILLGMVPEENQDYFQMVQHLADNTNNIKIIDDFVEREHLLSLMKQVDCIVAPSREDATNACIVEGLMLSKLCICSNMAGVSHYIDDCVHGFVFPIEKIEELCSRIMLVVDNFDRLGVIAQNGRKVYEEHYSMQVFEKTVKEYWQVNV